MDYTIQRIQADQLMVEAMAINVEVEGMKVTNQEREDKQMAFAYSEEDFQEKANQLWGISQGLIDCTRG